MSDIISSDLQEGAEPETRLMFVCLFVQVGGAGLTCCYRLRPPPGGEGEELMTSQNNHITAGEGAEPHLSSQVDRTLDSGLNWSELN